MFTGGERKECGSESAKEWQRNVGMGSEVGLFRLMFERVDVISSVCSTFLMCGVNIAGSGRTLFCGSAPHTKEAELISLI